MSRIEKMYGESPELARGEDGKMSVQRKESARSTDGTEGMAITESGMSPAMRQAAERRDMYNRHETEHAIHDEKKADKAEMHKRHAKELTDMLKRHSSDGGKRQTGGTA